MLGVDADGVDRAVGPDAARQLADRVDRVVGREVDRLRAGATGHVEPVAMLVDAQDPPGAHQSRADDAEDAHRTRAEHGNGVALADVGQRGAEPAGREDVREQDRLLVGDLVGQADETGVGVRDPGALGLQPVEAARLLGPAEERGARCVRVRAIALGVVARAAVRAGAAGDRRADHDAIARVEVAHAFAELLDDPHAFVTEDAAGLDAGHRAADEVQVGAADGARRQPDDGVLGALQLGFGHVVEADVPDAVEDDGFHARGPTHPPPGRQSPDVSDSTARRGSAGAARCPGGSGVTRASGRCRGARRSRVARGLL